jgi:hypothetical protein
MIGAATGAARRDDRFALIANNNTAEGGMASPTRDDFEHMTALIAEAVALCEDARQEFERKQEALQSAVDKNGRATSAVLAEEAQARGQLFVARMRLSRRVRNRDALLSTQTD